MGIFVEYTRNFGCIGLDTTSTESSMINTVINNNIDKNTQYTLNSTNKRHIWCIKHNAPKPIIPIKETKKSKSNNTTASNNSTSGSGSGSGSGGRKRRKSVSSKITSSYNSYNSYSGSRTRRGVGTVSYAGMD